MRERERQNGSMMSHKQVFLHLTYEIDNLRRATKIDENRTRWNLLMRMTKLITLKEMTPKRGENGNHHGVIKDLSYRKKISGINKSED